ncbi:MAG: hypothetical protein HFACDABA_00599 [Anaerolineales bacterium]|nr:hypothetical protein [Anaerolineales bacterium]
MKRLFTLASILVVLSLFFTSAASATSPSAPGQPALAPDVFVDYTLPIPVNIVFVGYTPSQVDTGDIAAWLPAAYEPVVRYPEFYGSPGRDMGLRYEFTYNYIFKNDAFNTNFFKYLKFIGTPGDPTLFQEDYNDQVNNILDVTGPVLYIPATRVETYLATKLGLTTKAYTIVFINWYNDPGFKFHVYTKTDEPDPDTGYNFGSLRSSRKMIAYGGSASRLWFYDFSAGPEAWTDNWNVDDTDVDGDGYSDYRMPPIWEYDAAGFHDPAGLDDDMGLLTRFVAINLLFTPSPLYDPMVTAPGYGGKKIVHINMMEDDPANTGTDWISPAKVNQEFKAFQPHYTWQTNMTQVDPIDAGAQLAIRIFTGLDSSNDCWNFYGDTFAEPFCYFEELNRPTYIPTYGAADYVVPIHAFNTEDASMGSQLGLLGFADDNWVDGTQSAVFQFDTPYYRALGYGFTATTIHEGGHHLSLSHPHDGYDWEMDIDYPALGNFYFANSGDESHTVMSYISLTNKFGMFNKDNLYRWETAGYLNWANELLADLQADPGYASVAMHVMFANNQANMAVLQLNNWNYAAAASAARKAYERLALAASILGVSTPDQAFALRARPNYNEAPHEGDPIRFPDN